MLKVDTSVLLLALSKYLDDAVGLGNHVAVLVNGGMTHLSATSINSQMFDG